MIWGWYNGYRWWSLTSTSPKSDTRAFASSICPRKIDICGAHAIAHGRGMRRASLRCSSSLTMCVSLPSGAGTHDGLKPNLNTIHATRCDATRCDESRRDACTYARSQVCTHTRHAHTCAYAFAPARVHGCAQQCAGLVAQHGYAKDMVPHTRTSMHACMHN